ncbi:MAG: hypothetical protein J5895_02240 [Alphaproteobacteria bacterium]|nr:hypothetical protein [Alphaproteobacteria bacterium]
MKKAAFLLIVMFLVFACAALKSYDDKLEGFVGKPESVLLSAFGTPTGQKILPNGEKVITYIRQETWYVPSEYFYDMDGWDETDIVYDPFFIDESMGPYSQIVDTEFEGICKTSFYIVGGVVASYKWQGSGCQ